MKKATESNEESVVEVKPYPQSEEDAQQQQLAPDEAVKSRPYAEKFEKGLMKMVNPMRIKHMKEVLTSLPNLKTDRALEVACGAGQLSRRILVPKFEKVDLFDQATDAIEEVKLWSRETENIGRLDLVRMQDFKFMETYTLIALNWSIGYLSDEELVTFLKKCKAGLGENKYPNGCLIVLDNEPCA